MNPLHRLVALLVLAAVPAVAEPPSLLEVRSAVRNREFYVTFGDAQATQTASFSDVLVTLKITARSVHTFKESDLESVDDQQRAATREQNVQVDAVAQVTGADRWTVQSITFTESSYGNSTRVEKGEAFRARLRTNPKGKIQARVKYAQTLRGQPLFTRELVATCDVPTIENAEMVYVD